MCCRELGRLHGLKPGTSKFLSPTNVAHRVPPNQPAPKSKLQLYFFSQRRRP